MFYQINHFYITSDPPKGTMSSYDSTIKIPTVLSAGITLRDWLRDLPISRRRAIRTLTIALDRIHRKDSWSDDVNMAWFMLADECTGLRAFHLRVVVKGRPDYDLWTLGVYVVCLGRLRGLYDYSIRKREEQERDVEGLWVDRMKAAWRKPREVTSEERKSWTSEGVDEMPTQREKPFYLLS